ncbi:YHS domain-containing (seleno)protein [Plastorhodobacter daqingensis]|uniref:YHS domain-containing (Seleno)protein n=1 Tax=Plastorhodobacter daqingensis TaxID=1387281 RepID=A0ABW2UF84_9RHOB
MTRFRFAIFVLAVVLPLILPAGGAEAKDRSVHAPGGIALAGYDPVAYFSEGRAVRGEPAHALRFRGAVWHFTSSGNLSAFEADPMSYFPQFGGYCVWALAQGEAVPGNPEYWTILSGRLYLSADPAARARLRDAPGDVIARAAAHWPPGRRP